MLVVFACSCPACWAASGDTVECSRCRRSAKRALKMPRFVSLRCVAMAWLRGDVATLGVASGRSPGWLLRWLGGSRRHLGGDRRTTKRPAVTGTVGLPWFHPGSFDDSSAYALVIEPSSAVTLVCGAVYLLDCVEVRGPARRGYSRLVRPGSSSLAPFSGCRRRTLLVLVIAFCMRLSTQYTAYARDGFKLVFGSV